MDILLQITIILVCLFYGARKGGVALGLLGGFGLIIMAFAFGLPPGKPPVDVMLTIIAVVAASATLQASGGLEVLLLGAERLLRRNPKYVSILAPFVTCLLTMLCGTGHVVYTMLPIIYDIAIKRCEQPWMTVDVQRSIRGHMLNYIKANYDYWTVLGFIRRLTARPSATDRNSPEGQRKALWRRRPPTSFVCSGFVQYGFLAAISRLIQTRELPREALQQVLFKPGLQPDAVPEEILATSPEDLAATDRLTWKYAIRGGRVYEVGSYEQVRNIFRSATQP